MKKRILPLLLAVLFVLGAIPFAASAETVTTKISAIDSARGEGELIVYTPDYGPSTATNQWGYEAVVGPDNKVISVGTNDSQIPEDGFVVSGHDSDVTTGKSKTWVKNNIHVGDYVYYNETTMTLTVSTEPLDMDKEVFFEITHAVNSLNGTRGENMMIVYNSSKGATTATNEYGFEVIVRNGLVTKLGGNNSNIPSDGFVVSGHGTSLDWLQDNVMIGMRCEYDKNTKTIKFIYDAEGLEKGLQIVLDAIPTAIEKAKSNFMYIEYEVLYNEHDKANENTNDKRTCFSTLQELYRQRKEEGKQENIKCIRKRKLVKGCFNKFKKFADFFPKSTGFHVKQIIHFIPQAVIIDRQNSLKNDENSSLQYLV